MMGCDCINNYAPAAELADFLNAVNEAGSLPKTILYSLNPNDDEVIGTIIGCFQNADTVGKNKKAIEEYIRNQLVEDEMMDQMTIKEYTDPFTGSKNSKA